ncbi:MAG TPA: glycosyltransferase [Candidatus Limnocylindrales bacterium]|jgi:GT2 family glycosyltransferase
MPRRISVIIPTLSGDAAGTIASLRTQTVTDWELIVVSGVRPAGRARNEGIGRATGDLLVFIDDDARFGDPSVLGRMVDALAPGIGVVGTAKLLPATATPFQQRVAREVPGWVHPVVGTQVDVEPPVDRYGFTAVTTTCCLIERKVLEAVGGFNETLPTGEDTELFYRIRRAGYRFVIPADAWAWHSPPATVRALARKCFWYGVGHCHEAHLHPERRMRARDVWRQSRILHRWAVPPRAGATRPSVSALRAFAMLATGYGYVWAHVTRRG